MTLEITMTKAKSRDPVYPQETRRQRTFPSHVTQFKLLNVSYGTTGVGAHPFMTPTRRGEGVMLRLTHVDGGGGSPAPCGRPHRKLKLESTDVILSSSHAKKLVSFLTKISS